MAEKMILITGATGLIGSHLAFQALEEGHRVCLLIRDNGSLPGAERFRQLAGFFGLPADRLEKLLSGVTVVTGDITLPRFGLDQTEWKALAQEIGTVFHSAACIEFDDVVYEKALLANVEGTRHALDFARQAEARLFHISTAYVAGTTRGLVGEDGLPDAPGFNNVYEQTKWQAEKLVHDTCAEHAMSYAVFRPAILTGHSRDGATFRFNNLSSFMRAFCLIRSREIRLPNAPARETVNRWQEHKLHLDIRVEGRRDATKNLVPVDYAVEAMWRLSTMDACLGGTFHITNPNPPTNDRLKEVFEQLYHMDGVDYVGPDSFAQRSPNTWEDALRKGTRSYRPYMFGETSFDQTHTNRLLPDYGRNFPPLDTDYFRRTLIYAMETSWGRNLPHNRVVPSARLADVDYVSLYFSEFLRSKMDRRLIANLKSLQASLHIRIREASPSPWRLRIEEGRLVELECDNGPVECAFETSASVFRKVAEGRLSPQKAFFERQVDISGDLEKALKTAAALSLFFEQYPFFLEHVESV